MARFVWHFGNNKVCNPFRLREALTALRGSALLGNLKGTERETQLALLLYASGVVKASASTPIEEARSTVPSGADSIPLLGRKWRSALVKTGLLFGEDAPTPYRITPNGFRLIGASTVAGQQECYLRSQLAYRIPSPNERKGRRTLCEQFSPLHFVLSVLLKLAEQPGEDFLSFLEIAAIVQTHTADEGVEAVASKIRRLRVERAANEGRLKRFEQQVLHKTVQQLATRLKPESLRDYADTNFRYLKATGLFVSKGRGITCDPKQLKLVKLIAAQAISPLDDAAYLQALWNGAALPTDNKPEAMAVVDDLASQLQRRKQWRPKPTAGLNEAQLNQLRHEYQDELRRLDELDLPKSKSAALTRSLPT